MEGPIPARWAPYLLSVLRIVVAFLFIAHGTQKLFGFPTGEPPRPPVPLMSLLGAASVIETFGGLCMLLGLFTRPIAFILAGEMAFAYFIAHAPRGLLPLLNGGELAVVYCFLFLYLSVAGGGAWSVDAYRQGAVTS